MSGPWKDKNAVLTLQGYSLLVSEFFSSFLDKTDEMKQNRDEETIKMITEIQDIIKTYPRFYPPPVQEDSGISEMKMSPHNVLHTAGRVLYQLHTTGGVMYELHTAGGVLYQLHTTGGVLYRLHATGGAC